MLKSSVYPSKRILYIGGHYIAVIDKDWFIVFNSASKHIAASPEILPRDEHERWKFLIVAKALKERSPLETETDKVQNILKAMHIFRKSLPMEAMFFCRSVYMSVYTWASHWVLRNRTTKACNGHSHWSIKIKSLYVPLFDLTRCLHKIWYRL